MLTVEVLIKSLVVGKQLICQSYQSYQSLIICQSYQTRNKIFLAINLGLETFFPIHLTAFQPRTHSFDIVASDPLLITSHFSFVDGNSVHELCSCSLMCHPDIELFDVSSLFQVVPRGFLYYVEFLSNRNSARMTVIILWTFSTIGPPITSK